MYSYERRALHEANGPDRSVSLCDVVRSNGCGQPPHEVTRNAVHPQGEGVARGQMYRAVRAEPDRLAQMNAPSRPSGRSRSRRRARCGYPHSETTRSPVHFNGERESLIERVAGIDVDIRLPRPLDRLWILTVRASPWSSASAAPMWISGLRGYSQGCGF